MTLIYIDQKQTYMETTGLVPLLDDQTQKIYRMSQNTTLCVKKNCWSLKKVSCCLGTAFYLGLEQLGGQTWMYYNACIA